MKKLFLVISLFSSIAFANETKVCGYLENWKILPSDRDDIGITVFTTFKPSGTAFNHYRDVFSFQTYNQLRLNAIISGLKSEKYKCICVSGELDQYKREMEKTKPRQYSNTQWGLFTDDVRYAIEFAEDCEHHYQ